MPLDEFHYCAKHLLRRYMGDAGEVFAAFLGIIIDVATSARDPARDNITSIFVTPFAPIMPCKEQVNNIRAAHRREMAGARIVAH